VLIAVEGIDGAGKTGLVRGLRSGLEARGRRVTCVGRYMVPEITGLWRRLVEADQVDHRGSALLAAADYRIGLERVIRPALAAGGVVVADRYCYSHLVYYHLRGVSLESLQVLFPDVLTPDVLVYLTVPVETAFERLAAREGKPDLVECGLDHRLGLSVGAAFRRFSRGGAPMAFREPHFLAYQAAAATLYPTVLPSERVRTIDGTLDPGTVIAQALEALDG
jgi:dTMP kinase